MRSLKKDRLKFDSMAKINFIILTLVFQITYSQNGVTVDYKVKINKEEFEKIDPMVAQKMHMINEEVENLEFELKATDKKSIFQKLGSMPVDEYSYKVALAQTKGKYTFYRDSNDKMKYGDVFGEEAIVILPKKKYDNWKILKENKVILGYRCYKATTSYESIDKHGDPMEVQVIAWFTPEINISSGPIDLEGLPGLILEGYTNPRYIFQAQKIETEKNLENKIIKPESKTKLSQNEYDDKVREVIKIIKNRNHSQE